MISFVAMTNAVLVGICLTIITSLVHSCIVTGPVLYKYHYSIVFEISTSDGNLALRLLNFFHAQLN